MSFLVSFNGQFQPYTLPDLSHYDKLHHVYKAKNTSEVVDFDPSPHTQRPPQNKRTGTNQKISSYEKVDKEYHREKIPHLAKDIMNRNIITLNESENLSDAKDLMIKHGIRHIPVLNSENTLIGIVSDRDLLGAKSNSLEDNMSNEVLTCYDTTRIQDISKIMLHEKISCLPIINDKHFLVGIVTQTDILNFVTRILSINDVI